MAKIQVSPGVYVESSDLYASGGMNDIDVLNALSGTGPTTTRTQASSLDLINRQRSLLSKAAKDQNDAALATLLDAENRLPGFYAEVKNNAAANSAQSKQAFNQYAAGSGLNSGTGGQAELSRLNTLGNAMTAADREMAGKKADIELQKNQLAAQLSSMLANIEANAAAQELAQWNNDRSFNYGMKRDELADQKNETAQQKADFLNTIGQYSSDYQAQINALENDGDPSNDWQIPYLKTERQNKIAGQNAAAAEQEQQDYENWLALQRLNNSGGGGAGTPTYSQISGALDDMFKSGASKEEMYNFVMQYGGQYASMLAAQYGLTAPSASTPQTTQTANVDSIVASLQRGGGRNGLSQQAVEDSLTSLLMSGQITEADVAYILQQLGYE